MSDQWSDQMRQFAIFPVFPPRADVQVGDLYMVCNISADTPPAPNPSTIEQPPRRNHKSMFLGRLMNIVDQPAAAGKPAVPGLLSKYYLTRVQMPVIPFASAPQAVSTPAAAASSDVAAAAAPAAPKKKVKAPVARAPAAAPKALPAPPVRTAGIFEGNQLKALMPVSMPEFFSVSVTKAQASALIPFPSVLAQAGLSYDSAQNISVSVPQTESYGLPDSDLWTEFALEQRSGVGDIAAVKQLFDANSPNFCANGAAPALEVVSEVYAARAIDVSITYSSETGGTAAVGLNYAAGSSQSKVMSAFDKFLNPGAASGTKTASAPEASGAPKPGNQPAADAAIPASTPTIAEATAFLAQLNQFAKQMGNDNTAPLQFPGVQISIVNGHGTGVIMSRRFASPVVIGYRGFELFAGGGASKPKPPAAGANAAGAASSAGT
ncbi:hypothetical protein [Paraburkholderia bryophila]|uniref:Uncharacterized protein n=1 Tax=Paraburkholderia bryophila TaxID=420952 RepID=A0A7Z0B774_9BURK|nr:hypothetical protein [Paraburkholderia bryophila]NYH24216.1 hypothetical protein [Paraburkholderia bryophila]